MPGWWNTFFYEPIDPSGLALFRIVIGLLVLADAVIYARSHRIMLSPTGLLSFDAWKGSHDYFYFSLFRWLPRSEATVSIILVIYGLAGFCVSIGIATPVAAAAALAGAASVHHRNRHVLHSGDAVLKIMCFLLIFSGAGSIWSVDAALAADGPTPKPQTIVPWALRLMQIQIAILYVYTFTSKLKGNTWRAGVATHYASNLLSHRRRRLPAQLDGRFAHRLATYGTLAAEFAGGVLVWFDATRYFALAAVAGLHVTLAYLMRMHLFQWIMIASLLVFVPGEDIVALVEWLRN